MTDQEQKPQLHTAPQEHGEGESGVFRSEELLAGRREIIILHNDDRYRLLVTRNGKLILQK